MSKSKFVPLLEIDPNQTYTLTGIRTYAWNWFARSVEDVAWPAFVVTVSIVLYADLVVAGLFKEAALAMDIKAFVTGLEKSEYAKSFVGAFVKILVFCLILSGWVFSRPFDHVARQFGLFSSHAAFLAIGVLLGLALCGFIEHFTPANKFRVFNESIVEQVSWRLLETGRMLFFALSGKIFLFFLQPNAHLYIDVTENRWKIGRFLIGLGSMVFILWGSGLSLWTW